MVILFFIPLLLTDWIWIFLIGVFTGILNSVIKDIFRSSKPEPTPETKLIAILGMKGAGKSELWRQLGIKSGAEIETNPGKNTSISQHIQQFQLSRKDGTKVTIGDVNGSTDIGGNDINVQFYDEIIKPKTFIYFLIDATKIEDDKHMNGVRQRLEKINDIWKKLDEESTEKGGSPNEWGIKFILTHIDQIKMPITSSASSIDMNEYVLNHLPKKYRKYTERIMLVNLLDPECIDQIINEIVK